MQHCGGLGDEGQPQITAAAFDVRQPARAFGATAGGQLLWLSLGHAKTFQNCQVHLATAITGLYPATVAGSAPGCRPMGARLWDEAKDWIDAVIHLRYMLLQGI